MELCTSWDAGTVPDHVRSLLSSEQYGRWDFWSQGLEHAELLLCLVRGSVVYSEKNKSGNETNIKRFPGVRLR